MMLCVKTIICKLIIVCLISTACTHPRSAAFLDENFAALLPAGTQALKQHFSSVVIVHNTNTSLDLYKNLEKLKPTVAFFSPLLTGELLSIMGTYPTIIPVVIADAATPVQNFSKQGYSICFNRERAIQQAIAYFSKTSANTIGPGILAIITDINTIETLKSEILKEFTPTPTNGILLEFYRAEDSVIGLTVEQLKQKNIVYAVISVTDSRLLSLIDALESKPEILAIIQGEPPHINRKPSNLSAFVYWDVAKTLKSITFSRTIDRWIQIEGVWKISK